MKMKEINEMTSEELVKKVGDLKNELFNLRFRLATGQLENPAVIKDVKRNIARVKTVIRERELRDLRFSHEITKDTSIDEIKRLGESMEMFY